MKVAVQANIRIAGDGYSLWPGDFTIVDDDDRRVAAQIARGALTVLDLPFGPGSPPTDDTGPAAPLTEPPPPR